MGRTLGKKKGASEGSSNVEVVGSSPGPKETGKREERLLMSGGSRKRVKHG